MILKYVTTSLQARDIEESSVKNLIALQENMNTANNWSDFNVELTQQVFLRYNTLDINVKAILEDHKLSLDTNQDQYYNYSSKQGTWLNNSEISAYLLTLGFVLDSCNPTIKGTCITYEDSNKQKLYFHNDGDQSFSGTSWTAMQLKGLEEYEEEKNIDYIHPSFGKYTLDALSHILSLRLNDLQLKDIEVLQGIFIDHTHNNMSSLFSQISSIKEQTILVPLNLFNKHAAGLIFEKTKNNTIQVKYLDSLNSDIPWELKQLIISNLGTKTNFKQVSVEHQKYANCSAEVIENFIFYLTGHRASQEKAIELHSKLVENSLLNIESAGVYLSLEDLTKTTHSYIDSWETKTDHDNQSHNVFYDSYQIEVAGDITAC